MSDASRSKPNCRRKPDSVMLLTRELGIKPVITMAPTALIQYDSGLDEMRNNELGGFAMGIVFLYVSSNADLSVESCHCSD